jgi:hypothetical protein
MMNGFKVTYLRTITYRKTVDVGMPSNLELAASSSTKWQNVTYRNDRISVAFLIIH